MKTYVITAEVNENELVTPCKLPTWFDPYEVCKPFRVVDDDGNVMYCCLSNDTSSFDAKDDYGAHCDYTGTQVYSRLANDWVSL